MEVKLIDYTRDALPLLIFSKKTRLMNSVGDFEKIKNYSDEELDAELKYIKGTINSSWEFSDYVFLISGVTRAFTHQLVRHRVGTSFAQQTQRATDMSGFDYLSTGMCESLDEYHKGMEGIKSAYSKCLEKGAHSQDVRGLLPTNILTNILFKANLRTLNGIMNIRLCYKAQGEFQNVARAMRDEVLKVHPWAEDFLEVMCVDKGVCAFPNFKECPIRSVIPDLDDAKRKAKDIWKNLRFEVQPVGDKKF